MTRKIATFVVLMLVALCAFAGAASASPGAYNVLIAHSNAEPPTTFRNAIAAFPDVARVDLFDTSSGTPTAAQLEAYDLVVSQSGDPAYQDQTAYGNALADFYDHGGVVIQYAWDNDINSDYAPLGR